MHDTVTTALDALGLLAVAGGVFFCAFQWVGGAALIPAGLVVLAGSAVAARLSRSRGERE